MKKRIFELGKRFFQTELVNGSSYIFIATFFGNILAFAFNVFLTRTLSYSNYGTFTSLISGVGQFTIFAQSLPIAIAQYATQYFSSNELGKAARLYKVSLRYMGLISFLLMTGFLLLAPIFSSFLQIKEVSYLWIAAIIIGLSYFGVVNLAFLQGKRKFGYLAFSTFMSNLSKLLFGVAFIYFGFAVLGALSATVISFITPLLLGFIPLWFLFSQKEKATEFSKKEIFAYMGPAALTSFALASFVSNDILLVKHFFSPTEAGIYSGLTLVGKIIFYFTAPIATVLFPIVIHQYHKKLAFKKTFYLALCLVLIPSLAITAIYALFPNILITIILGGKGYLALHSYLWVYGLFITVFSVLNITITFLLSLKKTKIVVPVTIAAISQIILIFLFHQNFLQIILISLVLTSILLVLILLYYIRHYEAKEIKATTSPISNNSSI